MDMYVFMYWIWGLGAGLGLGSWMAHSQYKSFKPMKKKLFELGELVYTSDGEGNILWKDGDEFK